MFLFSSQFAKPRSEGKNAWRKFWDCTYPSQGCSWLWKLQRCGPSHWGATRTSDLDFIISHLYWFCWLIILLFEYVWLLEQAVIENVPLKQQVFADLETYCPPHCILASNTSTIDINLIGETTKSHDRIVGAHFFRWYVFLWMCGHFISLHISC